MDISHIALTVQFMSWGYIRDLRKTGEHIKLNRDHDIARDFCQWLMDSYDLSLKELAGESDQSLQA